MSLSFFLLQHFNETIDVSRDLPKHQGEAKSR